MAIVLLFAVGASANLSGSTFEGNDGNLVVDTTGNTDWDNAPNLAAKQDLATGTGDNSFGQGTKEDDVNVHVGLGSIPNSKADLARFAVASEVLANGHTVMYLAWSREDDSGTVNFDFELNKVAQPDLTTEGDKTLNRSVNDALINYAFQGGANTPTLTRYHWGGSNWVSDGAISGSCSEGLTNSSTVSDTLGGLAPVDRTTQQFGEAAIDMTCAGIIQAGECKPFADMYVKSRSSTAFNSEVKDFIAPLNISLTNCGKLTIIKHTNPRGLDQAFGYTTSANLPGAFSLNDKGNTSGDSADNTKVFDNLQPGTYTVTEGDDPLGFAFESLTCVGAGGSASGKVATAVIVGGSDITCTYVNKQQLGAIKVTKTTKKPGVVGPAPQQGVSFTVNGVTKQTDANGEACFDGLVFGSYNVTETVPTGYQADGPTTKSVPVDTNTTCAASPYDGETVSFTNSPLTDVTISVDSKADGGTASTVDCDDNSLDFATGANGDGTKTSDAVAGSKTIHCTIVIDP